MTTIREWLTANRPKYTDRTKWVTDCVSAVKCKRKTVQNMATELWPVGSRGGGQKVSAPRGDSMNRTAFLAKYDDNTRIRNAIKKGLPTLTGAKAEDDDILEEVKFRLERCDCPNAVGFRPIAEEPEFAKHQFRVGDKIFWTTMRTREWALQSVTRAREV